MDTITSQGGPLILLERRLLRQWHGIFDPLARPRLPIGLGGGSDFDRACAITGFSGLLRVASTSCLVLTQGTLVTHWLQCNDRGGGGAFCQWNYSNDFDHADEEIVTAWSATRDSALERSTVTIRITDPEQFLIDAAEPGNDLESDHLKVFLEPGIYRVGTVTYDPDSLKSAILHHLLPMRGE